MPLHLLTRILVIGLILLTWPATVGAGARLDALAADGLLLEDVEASHLWPGSLADHDSGALIGGWLARDGRDERLHDGGVNWDLRYDLAEDWRGRVAQAHHADSGPRGLDLGAQLGWRNDRLGVGLAWHEKDIGEVPDTTELTTFSTGLRLAANQRTVVDLTLEWSRIDGDIPEATWFTGQRFRLHRTMTSWLTAVGVMERTRDSDNDELVQRYDFGLLLWPDPDVQILLAWSGTGQDGRRGHGLRFTAEARLSSWVSWRTGTLVSWPDDDPSAAPRIRLGLGASLHAGSQDLNVSWSRNEEAPAPGLAGHGAVDSRLRLEIARWF